MNLQSPKYIVAIGGSAGALETFERLVKKLPKDSSAAYVIIQHMSPTQKSLLPELLSKMSSIPVHVATQGLDLKPNHIYVIEPGTILTISHSRFVVEKIHNQMERTHPVDIFFGSIAAAWGTNACF